MAKTRYAVIPGASNYRAGTDGSIWSRLRFKGGRSGERVTGPWKRLKPDARKIDGRKRYTIKTDSGTYRRKYGSHFVLEAFVGPKPVGMEACHEDGDCTNDSLRNVRWDTPEANKLDMVKHGTRQRGEQINTAKLTEADVIEIRTSTESGNKIAKRKGVTQALVSAIRTRKVWKHVA